jgi:ESCRT-I complex subunit TSG101
MSPATPVSKPPQPHVQVHGHPPQQYGLESPVSPITPEEQRVAQYQRQAPLPPQHSAGIPRPQQYQQHQQLPPHPQLAHPTHQQQPPLPNYPPQQYQQYQQPPQLQKPPQPPAPINLLDDSLEVTIPSQKGPQVPLPVPPVPPNPEKDALLHALSSTLTAQIRQTVSQNNAAIPPLRAQQAALQTAYARLQSELDQLQQLDAALASNEKILREAMVEADRVMDDARKREAPDVDDVLVAPTFVSGQLYTVAAEERGIAEALFVLGRALDKGRVGADVFVKVCSNVLR